MIHPYYHAHTQCLAAKEQEVAVCLLATTEITSFLCTLIYCKINRSKWNSGDEQCVMLPLKAPMTDNSRPTMTDTAATDDI